MKIATTTPPNWDRIKAYFPAVESLQYQPIFCYGEIIFSPSGGEIRPDLIVHEKTHSVQQGNDPEVWWTKYCIDPSFRLEQEVEAYRAQYQFLRRNVKDKNLLSLMMVDIARDLASPLYGNLCTPSEARELIQG